MVQTEALAERHYEHLWLRHQKEELSEHHSNQARWPEAAFWKAWISQLFADQVLGNGPVFTQKIFAPINCPAPNEGRHNWTGRLSRSLQVEVVDSGREI